MTSGRATKPTPRHDLSCVDLFCGAGGLTHGFVLEGLRVNAGIDLDPACHYPYEANNGAKFIQRDISHMEGAELAALFTPGTIWVLAGCAPCQPFSTYSQRYETRTDRKWGLLYEFGRLATEVRPGIVTMENVPAIRRHRVFDDFVQRLADLGYELWYEVVDCVRYGVPQFRKRLVLLASLYGQVELIEPTCNRRNFKTVREVIGQLPPIAAGESDPSDDLHLAAGLSRKNLERIRASRPGGTWKEWPPQLIAECHQRGSGYKYPSIYGRMEWDKPAPTITTECYQYGSGRFGHPEQDRAISLREAALLQGFPISYRFVPPNERIRITTVARLIGNAVPVALGRAIAKSILRHVDRYAPIHSASLSDGQAVGRTDVSRH